MAVPLIARTVASKAAKGAAKGAARARKAGDKAYNARRRYLRSAERNLKLAEKSSGATAARYRQLAKIDLDNAMATYEKGTTQKFNKVITRIAKDLNVDIEAKRKQIKRLSYETAEKMRERAISDVKSKTRLVKSLQDVEVRRQVEAEAIFNSKIGRRIIGGLEEIWRPLATNAQMKIEKSMIFPSLFDYFEVDNLADLLDKIEEIVGEKLYSDEDSEELYESVKLTLQKHILTRLVA